MTDTIPWGDPRSIWPGPEWLAPRVLRDCPRCGWRRYAGNAGHHPCNGCGTLLRFVSVATAESEDVAVALRTRGIALGHVRARMWRFRVWLASYGIFSTKHETPEAAVRSAAPYFRGFLSRRAQGTEWTSLPWQEPAPRE
jgi:hypothetical protein